MHAALLCAGCIAACTDPNEFTDGPGYTSCKTCADGTAYDANGQQDGVPHTVCNDDACELPTVVQSGHTLAARFARLRDDCEVGQGADAIIGLCCKPGGAHGDKCGLECEPGYYNVTSMQLFECKPDDQFTASYQGGDISCAGPCSWGAFVPDGVLPPVSATAHHLGHSRNAPWLRGQASTQ